MNYLYYNPDIEYSEKYSPSEKYPEYPFVKLTENNDVYSGIRNILINLGLDKDNLGKPNWNPLGEYISPGQTVLIKPNLVYHQNTAEDNMKRGMECLVTHPSVVRCIFDYVYIALKGKGTIIIADAPLQGCDYEKLLKNTGYSRLFDHLESLATSELIIRTADLREVVYYRENGVTIQKERTDIAYPGVRIDLETDSYFRDMLGKNKLRVMDYDGKDTVDHHTEKHNEYCVSSALLKADVVISIPKPKSHRIAGYTAALKNFIGSSARKEYLPHHRIGATDKGGDEFVPSHRLLKSINSWSNDRRNHYIKESNNRLEIFFDKIGRFTGKKLDKTEPERFRYGMWRGNDTIWRTILDLNRVVLYADQEGRMQDKPQRKILYVGDMIVCGDHEGPITPSYKKVGCILFSDNPVEFDRIVVKLMGYDWKEFPVLFNAVKDSRLFDSTKAIVVSSNCDLLCKNVDEIECSFDFALTKSWSEW